MHYSFAQTTLQSWKLHCSFCNYNWIFALFLAFNLTNLKSRGYPDEELGGQEKSRITQEQENSKLDFWKLHCSFHLITIGFLLFPWPSTSPIWRVEATHMRNWVGKRRVELPKSKGTQNWTFENWKLHCSFHLITIVFVAVFIFIFFNIIDIYIVFLLQFLFLFAFFVWISVEMNFFLIKPLIVYINIV